MLRIDSNEEINLGEQDSLFLNSTLTSPKNIIEKPTKPYFDSLSKNDRSRRGMFLVFKDQDNDFTSNKLTFADSVTVKRNPLIDEELLKKSM